MATTYTAEIPFGFGGLDLASNERKVSPARSRHNKNVRKLPSGALTDREGFQVVSNSSIGGAYGMFTYERTDPTSFIVTQEQLIVASKLYRLKEYSFTVTYTGANQAVIEVLVDPATSTWKCKVYDNGVIVLNQDLGVGYDEAVPYTIGDLATTINALADFACTAPTGTSSLPAAFLSSTPPKSFAGGTVTIPLIAREEVNHPTSATDPFAGTHAARATSNLENVSAVEIDGNIYFASKYDEQKKYDGVDCYRAGMPTGVVPSTAEAASGALANGTYEHQITYVQYDANGNQVEGDESLSDVVTTVGGFGINVTVNNILAASGFNTDCAVVNGLQTGVTTITVDNGSGGNHTMKKGQTAYFYDGASASYVEREITSVAATTITIAGAAVNVADNAVISNNLRIRIYRTVTSGSVFKWVADIPNNSFTATQVYLDVKSDASLGYDYESPALSGNGHGLPPKGAYICSFNNRPVVAGLAGDPNGFAFAAVTGSEYYPPDNTDYLEGNTNRPITGCGVSDRYLWIFKGNRAFVVTGTLFDGKYAIDQRGDSIGCASHASIQSTDAGLIWEDENGFYMSAEGAAPVRISSPIESIFDTAGSRSYRELHFERCVAVWDAVKKLYIAFIPAEETSGADVYANSYSRIFVLDLWGIQEGQPRYEWFEWDSINMAGGATFDGEELWWTARDFSSFEGNATHKTYKRLNSKSVYDQVDHVEVIARKYASGWYDVGQPTVEKKFPYLSLFSIDPEAQSSGNITVRVEADFIENVKQVELVQDFGSSGSGSGWGFGSWGYFPWGNPQTIQVKKRRVNDKNYYAVRVVITGGEIYTKMVLSEYQWFVSAPFKIDMKGVRSG